MNGNYSPNPGAELQPPYDTALLSQRDLGLRVPINFVTTPGVSLSASCFPFGQYQDDSAGSCLSNLLSIGFRRFELDLYWDQGRGIWSFCPVEIPDTVVAISSTASLSTSLPSVTPATPTTAFLSSASGLGSRQETSSSPSSLLSTPSSSNSSTQSQTTLGTSLPTVSIFPISSNNASVSIGPYSCTTTINLSTFTSELLDYILATDDTLDAHMLYVILNIHAAASNLAPAEPAPAPTILPESPDYLGTIFSGNFSKYLYTQSNLQSDRSNLNDSWYFVTERYRPIQDFYTVTTNQYGAASTEDGWPSEYYVELERSKRLLVSWGTVDPQMAGYDFAEDSGTVFPSGYLQNLQENFTASSNGDVTSGCFLRNTSESVASDNSSWAADANLSGFSYPTSPSSDLTPLLNLALNTTNCGISPILNVTLLNNSAHTNYFPYQNYSYSTIWSWAPEEPKNYTTSADTIDYFRCATTEPSLNGRWIVSDCTQRYFAACRANNQPYNWTISTDTVSYSEATQSCRAQYSFSAPRTALENAYLAQTIRDTSRDYDGHGVWVDFNSVDLLGCWTIGGPNATCPWVDTSAQTDELRRRAILIPTIAAVLVLFVTALTLFVKCAGNRKTKKRTKRRAVNGFIYEGVPS